MPPSAPDTEPPRDVVRRRLSTRLLGLITISIAAPTVLFSLAGRSLLAELSAASAGSELSYQDLERTSAGASKHVDALFTLAGTGVANAVAAHLEGVLRLRPGLRRDPASVSEDPEVRAILSSQRLGPTTTLGIVDHASGRVVAHLVCDHDSPVASCMPWAERLLRDSDYAHLVRSLQSRAKEGVAAGMSYRRVVEHRFYTDPQEPGQPRLLVALATIAGTGWSLAIESRVGGVFDQIYGDFANAVGRIRSDVRTVGSTADRLRSRQRAALLLTAAVGATFLLLAGLWIRARVIRPLASLRATADQIRAGDLTTRSTLRTGDEIEVLAQATNFMLARLTASYRQLQDSQGELRSLNASLERRVEERTADLERANVELRSLAETKRQFYTNVSHELRTPLTLILGCLSSIRRAVSEASVHRDIEAAQRNAAQLLREINDLLDVAKLEAGRMTLAAAPTDLCALLREVAGHFDPASGDPDARRVRLDLPEAPQVLYLDQDKVRKIFFNLLSNAFKFTDPRSGRIDARIDAPTSDEVRVEISDNGVGIPESSLPFVFDRFRQADASLTRKYEGTGIGLALVKELAELHGGSVTVRSRVGEGSTFSVKFRRGRDHLPADQVQDHAVASEAVSGLHRIAARRDRATRPPPAGPVSSGSRGDAAELAGDTAGADILVVEDHAELRDYLRRLLPGYQLRTAGDGVEALASIDQGVPDLIISDVMMPRMDGFALCAAVKATPATAHVPILLLTAQAGLPEKLRGLDARADDYLTKPFHEEELRARVKNLLVLHAQGQALRALNQRLEARVLEQSEALQRRMRLQRFLPARVAEALLEGDAVTALARRRSLVAVLTADLCQFDELASTLTAEDLTALFGRFHTLSAEAIFSQGGTLVSLCNGTLVAVFGAPQELEEGAAARASVHAGRALLEAALALQEDFRAIAPTSIALRGAIDLGHATVGAFGDGEWSSFAAVGGPAARAPRLCEHARPGEILVSSRVAVASADSLADPRTLDLGGHPAKVWTLRVSDRAQSRQGAPPPSRETLATGPDPSAPPPEARDASRKPWPPIPAPPLSTQHHTVRMFAPGQVVGGRYMIEREVGRGGMGAVFACWDQLAGIQVALKLLPGDDGDRQLEHLRREVCLARLITHANVCRVYDLQLLDGNPAVTMELIEGVSLRERAGTDRPPLGVTLAWAGQLCAGLAAAHACGVVHRDLKPDNVLCEDKTGRLVIVDFGIAMPATAAPAEADKISGTLDYLAPEQLLPGSQPDARADLYALGVVLFELVTGELPHRGSDQFERIVARRNLPARDPAELVPSLDPRLRAVILRCLERDPPARFQRANDVAAALATLSGAPTAA